MIIFIYQKAKEDFTDVLNWEKMDLDFFLYQKGEKDVPKKNTVSKRMGKICKKRK